MLLHSTRFKNNVAVAATNKKEGLQMQLREAGYR
jgi:hypothetical protein